jgi:hypothetical protein
MSGSNIPSLNDLDRSKIQVARDGDQINLYYVDQTPADARPRKIPLHVKTSCWTCPFGRDDQGKLMVVIADGQFFKVEDIDKFGRDVCKYFLKHDGQDIPDDPDELPYKSLIQNVDGLDVLCLQMSERTRVFDTNGVKIEPDQALQWVAGQFSGNFLLSLGLRIWSGEDGSNTNGKFYWSVQPVQIKVRKYCTLPQGCKIFESEEELQEELNRRKKIHIKKKIQDDEPVVDFDPDVNELLD